MENKIQNTLKKLDPRNLSVTVKVSVLILALVSLILVVFFSIGLKTLHSTLINNASNQLEELCYIKSTEVEKTFGKTEEKILDLAEREDIRAAAEEFIKSFQSLSDDSYSILGPSTLGEAKNQMREYYEKTVVPNSPLSGNNILFYIPDDDKTIIAQYMFLYKNPKPYGEKDELIKLPDDNSAYSLTHNSYHALFLGLRKQLDARNIYLVDSRSGFVVYSVEKDIDFGCNLLNGKLKDSKLSEAYRMARASEQSSAFFVDYSNYLPACDKPVSFVSVPIFFYNEMVAVIIVQFDTRLFDNILTSDYMATGESSLEYTLIGQDLALRNNPKDFLLNKENFLRKIKRKSGRKELQSILNYERTDNMAMLAKYPLSYKDKLMAEGNIQMPDYNDVRVIAYSRKLNLGGSEFFLLSKTNFSEVVHPYTQKVRIFIFITLLLLSFVFIVARAFGNSLTKRITMLLDAMMFLHNGEKAKTLVQGFDDEMGAAIGAYNKLRKRINNAEEFALEMSEGNYNYKFEIISERDSLGKSLNVLKDKLIQSRNEHETRASEDEIRNWISTGIAKFNDLLRQNTNDINRLAYSIIENLTDYVNANISGVFLVEGDNEEDKHLTLVASYAYDRRKYHQKTVGIGEGLLGACYNEKKPIYLKSIPDDYIEISSGLGHEVPKCLYIVPLKVDEEVLGIIEIASFNEFAPHHIEFIDQVSNSIAATFVSVRLNMKTVILLEESKRKAEEIAQQEEEMRQNLEEMQATQEELARLRQDDEKHSREMQLIVDNTRSMLRNLLDAIPGGYILKDQNGIIHMINNEAAEIYGLSPDRILGKTDHELLGAKKNEAEHKIDMEVIDKGEKEYSEEREIKGEKKKFRVIKKPFNIKEIGQLGILTMRFHLKQ